MAARAVWNLYAFLCISMTSVSKEDRVMSLSTRAGLDFPSRLPTAAAPYFLLGLNSDGLWVIRETSGRRAGLFATREAAIKFAREESPKGLFTILQQPQGLELEPSRLGQAA
jgi:hypothetical protein